MRSNRSTSPWAPTDRTPDPGSRAPLRPPPAVVSDPDSTVELVVTSSNIVRVDPPWIPATGTFTFTSVPEPTTAVLTGLALVALTHAGRRLQ